MKCANQNVVNWVNEVAAKLTPDDVIWVDGSKEQYQELCQALIESNDFIPLNQEKYPHSFWYRSDPKDVARVEDRTFICSEKEADAGPTNIWADPQEMKAKLATLMTGCMKGRKMYVVPYLMGPAGSPYSKVGFELTDSKYVTINMSIMARVGQVALDALDPEADNFIRGIHSLSKMDENNRYICHFPETREIISLNTGYGGNALQGKKCFALRIASSEARKEGWLAEHMLILAVTTPENKKHYVCAAFPSACGKTNLAMLVPPQEYLDAGWKIETVGDDIAWLNFGSDGRLYAINPEAGFFGVAPGTSLETNPNMIRALEKGNCIFTNTALDLDKLEPWWEGCDGERPARLRDWQGREADHVEGEVFAHPNSRFTCPAGQCPCIDSEWESPYGVPISAIIFGGRRSKAAPLVYEAFNWQHGTFVGATMASEKTAAAAGKVGELRRDPMAMKPFIGYHVGDYFQHWLDIGQKGGDNMPRVFHVNWFRKNDQGKFMWPGFGDNMRVLEWVVARVENKVEADQGKLGLKPKIEDINIHGLALTRSELEQLLKVNSEDWIEDIESQASFFNKIASKLPEEMWAEHEQLKKRLALS